MLKQYLFFFFFNFFILVSGQMNPLYFNEYLAENYYRIHPAMAGVNLNGIRIDFGTRQQWFSMANRPSTQMLTLEYKSSANTTLGFSGVSDINGYHTHYKYNFTYCYRIFFNDEFWNTRRSFPTKNDNIQELSFGLNIGFSGTGLDQSSWKRPTSDPLVTQNLNQKQFTSFDASIAYVSTRFSIQFSIHNISVTTSNQENIDQEINYNIKSNKIFVGSIQYEIYTDSGWNFEPSILLQYEEKTQDNSLDLNFKIYRLIKDGRLWLGSSYRQNKISLAYNNGAKMIHDNYKHFTPIAGLNYKKMKFSYQYTSSIADIGFVNSGIHFVGIGVQF